MDGNPAISEFVPPPATSSPDSSAVSESLAAPSGSDGNLAASKPSPPVATLPVLKIPFAKEESSALWLRVGDMKFVAVCLLIGLGLLYFYWIRLSRWGAEPIEIDRLPERRVNYRLDINRATKYEWAELDGIGETLAERIVQNREQNGPFRSVEDLRRVRGIGARTLEKLAPHLEVSTGSPAFPSDAKSSGRQRRK